MAKKNLSLPKLGEISVNHNAIAKLYGGILDGAYFKKVFRASSEEEAFEMANEFVNHHYGFRFEFDDLDDACYRSGHFFLDFMANGPLAPVLIVEQFPESDPLYSLKMILIEFRNERNWRQFHTPKNLAMALGAEVGELQDLFLWDRENDIKKSEAASEMADIMSYLLLLADELGIDLFEALIDKVKTNNEKYKVETSKGNSQKH